MASRFGFLGNTYTDFHFCQKPTRLSKTERTAEIRRGTRGLFKKNRREAPRKHTNLGAPIPHVVFRGASGKNRVPKGCQMYSKLQFSSIGQEPQRRESRHVGATGRGGFSRNTRRTSLKYSVPVSMLSLQRADWKLGADKYGVSGAWDPLSAPARGASDSRHDGFGDTVKKEEGKCCALLNYFLFFQTSVRLSRC